MQLPKPLLERGDLLARRLDDYLALRILLDAAAPAVHRRHRGQDVHAGGQVFLDERPRERERVGVGAEGGKDEYDVEIDVEGFLAFPVRMTVLQVSGSNLMEFYGAELGTITP